MRGHFQRFTIVSGKKWAMETSEISSLAFELLDKKKSAVLEYSKQFKVSYVNRQKFGKPAYLLWRPKLVNRSFTLRFQVVHVISCSDQLFTPYSSLTREKAAPGRMHLVHNILRVFGWKEGNGINVTTGRRGGGGVGVSWQTTSVWYDIGSKHINFLGPRICMALLLTLDHNDRRLNLKIKSTSKAEEIFRSLHYVMLKNVSATCVLNARIRRLEIPLLIRKLTVGRIFLPRSLRSRVARVFCMREVGGSTPTGDDNFWFFISNFSYFGGLKC